MADETDDDVDDMMEEAVPAAATNGAVAAEPQLEIKVLPDAADLPREAAERIVAAADAKLADNQHHLFSLVLSGGVDAQAALRAAGQRAHTAAGSTGARSRSTSATSGASRQTTRTATTAWPTRRCYPSCRCPSATSTACAASCRRQQAATEYGQLLKAKFHDGRPGPGPARHGRRRPHRQPVPRHIAALDEQHHRCVANHVEKLNTWRHHDDVPVPEPGGRGADPGRGDEEGPAAARGSRRARATPKRLPIQGIRPAGQLTWLVDAAAANMMDE